MDIRVVLLKVLGDACPARQARSGIALRRRADSRVDFNAHGWFLQQRVDYSGWLCAALRLPAWAGPRQRTTGPARGCQCQGAIGGWGSAPYVDQALQTLRTAGAAIPWLAGVGGRALPWRAW